MPSDRIDPPFLYSVNLLADELWCIADALTLMTGPAAAMHHDVLEPLREHITDRLVDARQAEAGSR